MNLPACLPQHTINKWIWVIMNNVCCGTHIYLSIQQTQNIHLEYLVWFFYVNSHLYAKFRISLRSFTRLHIYLICFFSSVAFHFPYNSYLHLLIYSYFLVAIIMFSNIFLWCLHSYSTIFQNDTHFNWHLVLNWTFDSSFEIIIWNLI